jgi:hypothetical protein
MTSHLSDSWDKASVLKLTRHSPMRNPKFCVGEVVDPEMNFFILMLEQLDIETQWSCAGHDINDAQLYMVFAYPGMEGLEFARQLSNLVKVDVLDGQDKYRIFYSYLDCFEKYDDIKDVTQEEFESIRNNALRDLANIWESYFGPLDFENVSLEG